MGRKLFHGLIIAAITITVSLSAIGEEAGEAAPVSANPTQAASGGIAPTVNPIAAAPEAVITPYRTFVTIKEFKMEQNGDRRNPISNVRLRITFPGGNQLQLPEGGEYWPIGNGQVQEINRTYELPWEMVSKDGFNFNVQMERTGSKYLPCEFQVIQLSQFNRSYVCHTDIKWQMDKKKIAEPDLDREGIVVRVFTDRNSTKKEIPTDAITLRILETPKVKKSFFDYFRF